MSYTRLQLRTTLRHHLNDEAADAWSDQSLNQFLHDAIAEYSRYFPREVAITISCVTDTRTYSLTSNTNVRDVLEVEYPAGQDPPRYLVPRSRVDPEGFWGYQYYDLLGGDKPNSLIIGQKPTTGQTINVLLLEDHAYPDADSDVLTTDDRDLILLVDYAEGLSYRALVAAEAAQPTLGTSNMSQLLAASNSAENAYRNVLAARLRRGTTLEG